ncbi:MAG: hypothetical protein Kow0047_33280 [Anaerolineae bacterium]
MAEDVPALGMRWYRIAENGAAGGPVVTADANRLTLENGILSIQVHPASGALSHLIDLESGRDLAGRAEGMGPEVPVHAGKLNRLQIWWEQPHPMSAWNIGDITRVDHLITGAEVRVVDGGPVRATIEVTRNVLHSTLRQRIHLYRWLRRIDFETEIDWHERGSAHADAPMLRATFTPAMGETKATFEVPFAAIERVADGREVPALRWADLSEEGYGLSLLNDGKYGHQAQGNTLGLTLVRASYEPDRNPDEGLHRFTYALYPHLGTWREAGTDRRAAELNQPLLALPIAGRPASMEPGRALLEVNDAGVMVTAVKLAEDQPEAGKAVIVRLCEMHGRPATVTLRPAWPVERAEQVNVAEEPMGSERFDDGAITLALRPYEIRTVRLICPS